MTIDPLMSSENSLNVVYVPSYTSNNKILYESNPNPISLL